MINHTYLFPHTAQREWDADNGHNYIPPKSLQPQITEDMRKIQQQVVVAFDQMRLSARYTDILINYTNNTKTFTVNELLF